MKDKPQAASDVLTMDGFKTTLYNATNKVMQVEYNILCAHDAALREHIAFLERHVKRIREGEQDTVELIGEYAERYAKMEAALQKIAEGSGAFSRDHRQHLLNCFNEGKETARAALDEKENKC